MEIEMGTTKFRKMHEALVSGSRRKHDLVVVFNGDIAKVISYLDNVVLVCKIFATNLEKAFLIVAPDWADGYKSKYYTCNRVKGTKRCKNKVNRSNCPKKKGIPCRCRDFESVISDAYKL